MEASTTRYNFPSQRQKREYCLGVRLGAQRLDKDSGYSKNMMGNRKLFSTYKAYNGGNVIFGSNLRGNIIGKDNQSGQFRNQRIMTVVGARETECRKPKWVKDYKYHKEKMLLCKQAEKGVQLQAEQSDWLAYMDEEIDEQELEAHYSYMAKIQEVHNADSDTDSEPLEQVQYDTRYNVFANEIQHSEQSESISNTCVVETVDSNVIPDLSDMCDNDIQNDQNAVECDDERVALANLIANLKLDVDENKKIQKQLKKENASLTQELKECKSTLEETSRTLRESNSIRDSCLVALQNKQTEFERYKAFNDRTVDYDKLESYEISVVKEKHDELVKQSLLTKSHYEGLVKEKTKVITDLKLKEEKDIDKMISMENQLKFLNEIVYKRCQSIQTIHMLAPKCPTFNGRPTFANPMYLKKAQYEKPCLYEIPHDQSDPANRLVPDREETLTLEKESRSKLNKDLVKPFDYTKLNTLVKTFLEIIFVPTAKDIEILIKTCLMPLALKTQNDSFTFVHELKQEMHADLKMAVLYDVMCSYLHSLSDLDAHSELQCLYPHKVKECECLAQKLSKQTESVSKEVYTELLRSFAKLEKHSISLELALQQCQEQMKNDTVCKEKASNIFLKEREQYFEIQDLKAQLQDKNIAICMYRIDTRTAQTRVPQLTKTYRNTNPRVSTSTGVNHRTNVSRPHIRSTQMSIKVVPNNSQVKDKKNEVEDHPRISSISNKTKSVTTCNDSLKSRTSNVNAVCATCGKCVFNSNHDACVSKYLNDVNARTKKPNNSKSYYRMLYEKTSKAWKWWIEQQCLSGYKWVPKTKMKWVPKVRNENVQKRVSFAIENASRITNIVQLILFIVESGCTKHMTGNLTLLCNFVEKYPGTVCFGNDQFAPILSYGDLVQGNIMINMGYYVEGLNHNLFSVGQFCDADLEVAFRKSTCFVRDLQGNDLLIGNRGSDLYTISLQETTSSTLICLMAKASPT
ncbi:hypothetical protein Tco_1066728 [Tanacetum coccineum]|uniref:Retrovirus-related Pol polyprotein from transposon TNT 1-94-like beta-barrel domain-containing protein n=1 Tax=Tanacetum coccineum TaxID=301880 RepID=A0ABQ5HAU6_9ASTR